MATMIDLDEKPVVASPQEAGVDRRPWGPIIWSIVGCLLLVFSGVFRIQQDRRFDVEKNYLEQSPFPLKTLPTELGGWKVLTGGETTLDPLTTRITGATDHVIRTYVDELTGVTLQVLILFGPAEPVSPHTPQVCYPACGYSPMDDPSDRVVPYGDGQKAVFRSEVFAKMGGRSMLREVAYHSFRLEGPWLPDIATGRRFPRKNPGIFKVQVQRRVVGGERRDRDDPVEHFLANLLPEIDRRVVEAKNAELTAAKKPSSVKPMAQ